MSRPAAKVLAYAASRRMERRRQRRFWDRLPFYYRIYRDKGMSPIKALRSAVRIAR